MNLDNSDYKLFLKLTPELHEAAAQVVERTEHGRNTEICVEI
jgi:hypothetical protein